MTPHETVVHMQGMFEHKPLWYWRCICGDQGTMLTTEQGAHDEAQAHVLHMGHITAGTS